MNERKQLIRGIKKGGGGNSLSDEIVAIIECEMESFLRKRIKSFSKKIGKINILFFALI